MTKIPKPRKQPQPIPVATTQARRDAKRNLLLALLLLALAVVVYIPALNGAFLWDDAVMVRGNQLVTGEMSLKTIWFKTDFPLSLIFLWIEWLLFGSKTLGYHVVNVLLHGCAAVLLWRVLRTLRIHGAWLAGAIFAVHPVCAASVAWISELKNTLSAVLFLLSALLYFQSDDSKLKTQNSKLNLKYWLALLAFLLALLAKTSTVALPVVLLAIVWWKKNQLTQRDFLRTAPFFLLALAFGLLTIHLQSHGAIAGEKVQSENLPGRVAGAGYAVWFYLYKTFLPVNLSMIYPRWEIDVRSALVYLPDLFLIALAVLFWRKRRSWGHPTLAVLIVFAALLFPALGFFDMYFLVYSRVSDHFQYIALLGVIAFVAAALESKLQPAAFKLVAIAIVLVLGVLTFERAKVFQNEETLWSDTLKKNPQAWCAHNNLGNALFDRGNSADAIGHYLDAMKINPKSPDAHNNLGVTLVKEGRIDDAIEQHFEAVKLQPRQPKYHFNLGAALAKAQRLDEAIAEYRAALNLKPNYADAHNNLSNVLNKQGKSRDALAEGLEALRIRPDFPEAHFNVGNALSSLGKSDEAVAHFSKAIQLRPDFIEAHYVCAMEFARAGNMAGAEPHLREVVRLNPGDALAHSSLGNTLAIQDKLDAAVAEYIIALKLTAADPETHYNLGLTLVRQGKRGDALKHFAEAVRLKPDYVEAQKQRDALAASLK